MADAEEPLMRHEPGNDEEEGHDVDLSDVSLLLEKNLRNPGIFVWLLTFSAGISGLLFGCMFYILNFTINTNAVVFR
jgi:MFS transporter, SP family, solute carrier family 2 (myo-inositol transporter), member 13